MVSAASADCCEKFETVAVQWVAVGCALVLAAKLSGLHVLLSVTAPCFFTNATGIVTVLAPLRGTRLIRPWYCPFATDGASIVIGKVTESPLVTWIGLPLLTVIVTPAGC